MINAVDEHQCMIISSYSHCRCVAISLPTVKLTAVKYDALTSNLRYTSLSAREMRDPGKDCDDLVTLSRTGNLASVHRVTLVLSANIYFVRRWAYLLFYSPYPKYRSLVPRWSRRATFPALDIRDGAACQSAWHPEIFVRLSNFIKVLSGYHDHTANKVTRYNRRLSFVSFSWKLSTYRLIQCLYARYIINEYAPNVKKHILNLLSPTRAN